ncbi:MAG: ice-binding family protein [Byssovorax sp.]
MSRSRSGAVFLLLSIVAGTGCTMSTEGLPGGTGGAQGTTGAQTTGAQSSTGGLSSTGAQGSTTAQGSTGSGQGGAGGQGGSGGQGGMPVTAPPTVIATVPASAAQGVATSSPVQATFSAAMNPATLTTATFLVTQGGIAVPGTVTAMGATATFAPTVDYAPSSAVTATITTGAKDASGKALAQDYVWSFTTAGQPGQPPIVLGLAAPFGVLAHDMVTNTASPGTIVTGDLGISPGMSLVGFPPGQIVGGTYLGLMAKDAQTALVAAYTEASMRPGGLPLAADIAAKTFLPGLYKQPSAVALSTGVCTLDAQGNPAAVFIFQIGTAFGMAASTKILLIGGAKATNVYWVVGAAVTLGANATLEGTVLTVNSITLGASVTVDGRLLASGPTVTLDTDLITVPGP